MKILVLGSEGVIGKELCRELEASGHEVQHYDIKLDSKQDLSVNFDVDVAKYDFVYFLAYNIGGSKYILNNSNVNFINDNVMIMYNVFNKLSGCKFIFASSQMENMYVPYGTLKRLGEHYTTYLGGISVRFWNVYGNEDINEKSHVIPDFIHKFKTKGFIDLNTNGQESRQFLHTRDCAKALIAIMNNYDEIKTKRNVVDVTNFEWTRVLDLALIITEDPKLVYAGSIGDSLQTCQNQPDTFILDYWKGPEISLKDAVKEMMNNV